MHWPHIGECLNILAYGFPVPLFFFAIEIVWLGWVQRLRMFTSSDLFTGLLYLQMVELLSFDIICCWVKILQMVSPGDMIQSPWIRVAIWLVLSVMFVNRLAYRI